MTGIVCGFLIGGLLMCLCGWHDARNPENGTALGMIVFGPWIGRPEGRPRR